MQSLAKDSVYFVSAPDYHFCLNMPRTFLQPGNGNLTQDPVAHHHIEILLGRFGDLLLGTNQIDVHKLISQQKFRKLCSCQMWLLLAWTLLDWGYPSSSFLHFLLLLRWKSALRKEEMFSFCYVTQQKIYMLVYWNGLKSGPQVARIFQAIWGRSARQQQYQKSSNLGTTI